MRLCDEHQARTVQKGPVIGNLTEVTSADVTRAVSRHRPHGLDDCDPCSGYWSKFCAVGIFKICKSYSDLIAKSLFGRFQFSSAIVLSDGTAPRWWSYAYQGASIVCASVQAIGDNGTAPSSFGRTSSNRLSSHCATLIGEITKTLLVTSRHRTGKLRIGKIRVLLWKYVQSQQIICPSKVFSGWQKRQSKGLLPQRFLKPRFGVAPVALGRVTSQGFVANLAERFARRFGNGRPRAPDHPASGELRGQTSSQRLHILITLNFHFPQLFLAGLRTSELFNNVR